MQVTDRLVNFVFQTKFSDIPEAAHKQAKAGILDWLFVTLAAQKQENSTIQKYTQFVLSKEGNPESTIIGSQVKTTENQAAMFNGIIGHLMDYDETCPTVRSHLFAAILPALLAVTEHRCLSGKELLASFAIAHEVSMRVGEAITPKWIGAGWHGTSLFGIFGAAMGCAKLMGLDRDQIRMALGLVVSMASGVAVNFGTLAKPMHAGMAAERGLTAAQLAQIGFTSNPKALDGELGFYHVYNWGEGARLELFDTLANPWGLETPGMSSLKLYPCCHGLSTNIECGIRIHNQHNLELEDIDSVEIHSQPKTLCAMLSRQYADTGEGLRWGYAGPPRQMQTILPKTGAQAKFSKEYAFSRAVKDGAVRMQDLTDEAVNEPEIRQWMNKIKLYHNSEMEHYSTQYPEHTGPHAERMIVKLKNGRVIQEEEIFIQGMTKRPLSFNDVTSKYQDCGTVAGLLAENIDGIISQVKRLEDVNNVATLVESINSKTSNDD